MFGNCETYYIYQKESSLKLDSKYLLLKFDIYNFYFPKIWFYKFEIIKKILIEQDQMNESNNKILDLNFSEAFNKYIDLNNLNFRLFPTSFYYLCINNIQSYDKKNLIPCLKFLEFLELDKEILKSISTYQNIN
jgi:hypothetical protein